jgi:hypothetical protein
MMDNLIVIRTYTMAQLAHLDAARLAQEGIDSTIHDETMTTMMPHLMNAMGGVKLLVNAADGNRAITILDES